MRKPRILLVDDERVVVEVLTSLLDDPDREILPADSAASALQHARAGEIEVALVDKNLGTDSGLELSRQLKQMQPDVEIILITGYASIESAIQAVQIGAFDYLTKPIADFAALSFKVQSALEKSQLRRSQRALLERLMECEVRHRRLIDAAPEAIVLYDVESGRVMEANEAAVKLYGYSPQELLHAAAVDLRGGTPEGKPGPVPVLQRHRHKDGTEFTAEVIFTEFQQQGRTLRVQSVREVSQREQGEARRQELEQRLRSTQRLDAIGRLAGGVAQDFTSLLAVISSHATALQGALGELPDLRAEADAIARAVSRGNALTQQLQLFSHRVPHENRPLDVNAIVAEAHKVASRLPGDNIRVALESQSGLWVARAHPDQLMQIILDLAVNARDAMRHGGKLALRTNNVTLDAPARLRGGQLPAGRYVRVQAEDDGEGMSEDALRHLFEPFFTTKNGGRALGLGLATVYGIADALGGGVDVESRPGKGTCVSVYLPAVEGRDPGAIREDALPSERILLVEDEESLRVMMRRMLTSHGYDVFDAGNAEEGLRAVDGRAIDLLLTDVDLPRVDGPGLARKLIAAHPALRVLYIGDAVPARSRSPQPLIRKPFTPVALLGQVRRVLDGQVYRE